MTKKAAIYARLSVDRDADKTGIASQVEDARVYAERHQWEVVAEYVERNITAAHIYGLEPKTRPEYERMVADARAGKIEAVYIWKTDRLTRQPRQAEDWIELAAVKGVEIHGERGDYQLNTDAGAQMFRMEVSMAYGETKRASDRQKRNKQYRRDHGLWHGGPPPFGYRAQDKQLIPNPAEVEVIHEAVRRVLAGDSLNAIVTDWNKSGRTTRTGKHWRQTALRAILRNRSLLGETKAGVQGWEPIISESDFDRLQRVFDDPGRKVTHSPGVKGGKYTMVGVTFCGVCGGRLVTHAKRRTAGGEATVTLSCLRRINGMSEKHPLVTRTRTVKGERVERLEDSGRVSVSHDLLERHVFESVVQSLRENDEWGRAVTERDPKTAERIAELEARSADLLEKQRRINDMHAEGLADIQYVRAEVGKIAAEREKIARQVADLQGKPVLAAAVADGLDWESWPTARRRNFLKALGVRVEVGPWPTHEVNGVTRDRARNPIRLKRESDAEYRERLDAHYRQVVADRVNITAE